MMGNLRETFAKIIDGTAFRPQYVSGEGLSETEKEKWLRARNSALFKSDQIFDALKARLSEPE
jgi:hypothetical protein